MLRFALLGPVAVGVDGGEPVPQPAGIPTTVLSVLLLHANQVVPRDRLVAAIWGEDPPTAAAAGLRNHVSRLRRQLGERAGARVRTVAPGYRIDVQDRELDVQRFLDDSARGRRALAEGDLVSARRLLGEALALWRGEPLGELPPTPELTARVHGWQENRLLAVEGRIEADLGLGRHHEAVAELRALIAEHTLREGLHGLLMLALYRAGRQAEALEAYQVVRGTLADELGVDPSPALQRLHAAILRADPELDAPSPDPHEDVRAAPAKPSVPAPRTAATAPAPSPSPSRLGGLPGATRAFTGRARELAWLEELGSRAPYGSSAGMALVATIDGMGGVGKSALAVHAARRLRPHFPDGALFVDLHAHTPGVEPLSAHDALDRLLRALSVPAQLIPRDTEARAAAFHDRVAGSRTLLLLDNAASSAEIRPLLPAEPGSLVLVTSRRRLAGLDDAHQRTLEPLPAADADGLIRTVAGTGRIPDGSAAAAELAELCGSMPLALRVAASRLRRHRSLRVEDVVAELRDERLRLSGLNEGGDAVEAVFASSYAALPEPEQQLFRLLGLVPGPDFDAAAVAWLLGCDRRTAAYRLEALLDHSLLQEPTVGRYRFHDLVRLFARSTAGSAAGSAPAGADGESARRRLIDYYLHAAGAANDLISRRSLPAPRLAPPPPPLPATEPGDLETALAWLRAEWPNLWACAAAPETLRCRPDALAVFSPVLGTFMEREGHWAQALALHERALADARARGDVAVEGSALLELGRIRLLTSDVAEACALHEQALRCQRALGDRLGEAEALWEQGRARHMDNQHEAAAALHSEALAVYRELGDERGEANATWALGRALRMQDDADGANAMAERALALYRRLGDRLGTTNALWDLGRLAEGRGDFAASARLLEQALDAYRVLGSRVGEANSLHSLGRLQRRLSQWDAAVENLEASLRIFGELRQIHGTTLARHDLALVRWSQGELTEATRLLTLVSDTYRAHAEPVGAARSLHELGQVLAAAQDYAASARALAESLTFYRELGNAERTAAVLHDARTFATEAAAAFPQ
ncbi:AfsR/SARP family transcriptional regulator [Streptacidiphilus neutrinimicus]|uniref:AfsR/SARP family transcriptional regulator n=1 Tax=Streptacidiphilus neutrinimicus TaxID=105420 RepID=UPI0006936DA8|nr:BTAD domain-containing putative transcriptional regulator [Streptacidiphilus neutrinimicus]